MFNVKKYGGNYYGSLEKDMDNINTSKNIIFQLTPDRALKMKERNQDTCLILILPPSVEDLCYNDNKICTDVTKHASTDPSFKGIKKMLKEDKSETFKIADEIIRNTFRVLLTRGKKGYYIYCVDKELNHYLKNTINLYSIDK